MEIAMLLAAAFCAGLLNTVAGGGTFLTFPEPEFYPHRKDPIHNAPFTHRRNFALDYALAIRRNRDQLRQIVLALFALAQMRVGGSLFTLRRDIFAAILLVLRPAESAVRRLIVIAAAQIGDSYLGRNGIAPLINFGAGQGNCPRVSTRAFKLFDPLKSFDPESIWDVEPKWESHLGPSDPTFHYISTIESPLDATHLGQRLNALMRALDNIPHQARRLVRWQAKRDAALKATKPTRMSPMRPGLPPGWRQRRIHEVDEVLRECHLLAWDRQSAPDTS